MYVTISMFTQYNMAGKHQKRQKKFQEKNYSFSKCSQKSCVQWVVVVAVVVVVAPSEIKKNRIQDISHFFVCTHGVDKIEMLGSWQDIKQY